MTGVSASYPNMTDWFLKTHNSTILLYMIRLIHRQWLVGLAVITSTLAITFFSGMGQTRPPSDHAYGKEAYVILVCMGNLLRQAGKTNEQIDFDYKNLSTVFDQQAWV